MAFWGPVFKVAPKSFGVTFFLNVIFLTICGGLNAGRKHWTVLDKCQCSWGTTIVGIFVTMVTWWRHVLGLKLQSWHSVDRLKIWKPSLVYENMRPLYSLFRIEFLVESWKVLAVLPSWTHKRLPSSVEEIHRTLLAVHVVWLSYEPWIRWEIEILSSSDTAHQTKTPTSWIMATPSSSPRDLSKQFTLQS